MKKKKLIFFANDRFVSEFNTNELKDFFEDTIEVKSYITNQLAEEKSIDGDLVLTLTPVDINHIKKYLSEETDIIQGTRTILVEKYNELKKLPSGTTAMVFNINKRSAFGLSTFLIDIGIDHIEYFPGYNGKKEIPNTDVIIIADELDFDIAFDKSKTINLNYRRITVETYKAIMMMMDIHSERLEKKLAKYSTQLAQMKYTVIPVSTIYKTEKILHATINEIDYGIIIINDNNKIIYVNDALLSMLNISKSYASFQYLNENILPKKTYRELLNTQSIDFKILNVDEFDKKFILSKKNIKLDDNRVGSIITLKDVTKIEKLEVQLRGLIAEKGYVAKYTFDDIVGISNIITNCKEKAKKMALIDKTVLVIGESGTGKEMFVQAIHNFSNRKNSPFVAINCASLSSELLESELFGYEEGSFTGAKKGGKKGLFELAHRGTIFLDEIGDISPEVQIKLLRVLQEKEIRRIGGDSIIPVDVRVIVATNRNLGQMVTGDKFRMDLYYRLNVFTLIIPPIRERKDDIPLIINNILDEIGCTGKKIDENLMEIFNRCKWEGNIRELKNCIEYMSYMGQDVLSIADLPPYFSHEFKNDKKSVDKDYIKDIRNCLFEGFTRDEKETLIFIVRTIKGRSVGRVLLHKLCFENGYNISEYKLRVFMSYLNDKNYIKYGGGRKGAEITDKGILLVDKCDFVG